MIRLDEETRRKVRALDAEKRAELAPAKKLAAAERKADRKVREKALVRRLPCVVCGTMDRVEAAHVRAGYPSAGWRPTGMQEKPDDARVVPLCAHDHREGPDAQHKGSERLYWSARGIDPPDLCAALRKAYALDQDGAAVVRRFTPSRREDEA